jgi:hypothetical protein
MDAGNQSKLVGKMVGEQVQVFNFRCEINALLRIIGGAKRDRTADLFNAIEALSQLSYSPTF